MLLAGQKVKTSPAGKPASKFRPFFPWYSLSYQVAPHCVLPQPSKAFVIRSFFFEKWLLTHALGGPKGQNFSCRQACVEVPAFFPLVFSLIPGCSALRAPATFKSIRNPLIFLRKMATYSCFWRAKRSKLLLQASLRRSSGLFSLGIMQTAA